MIFGDRMDCAVVQRGGGQTAMGLCEDRKTGSARPCKAIPPFDTRRILGANMKPRNDESRKARPKAGDLVMILKQWVRPGAFIKADTPVDTDFAQRMLYGMERSIFAANAALNLYQSSSDLVFPPFEQALHDHHKRSARLAEALRQVDEARANQHSDERSADLPVFISALGDGKFQTMLRDGTQGQVDLSEQALDGMIEAITAAYGLLEWKGSPTPFPS